MAYLTNPFLDRRFEQMGSDHDFVRLFSPRVLDRLPDEAFLAGVHIFRSPPGGGKTTLLRAFTPACLRAFWAARQSDGMIDTFQRLSARNVLDDSGPSMLGVLLSCASGYADLPPSLSAVDDNLFRALFNCRVVSRTLRSLVAFLEERSIDVLQNVRIVYGDSVEEFYDIPKVDSALELMRWAEGCERNVYKTLDALVHDGNSKGPGHLRFESIRWLQRALFYIGPKQIEFGRLLLVDDVNKLRKRQRAFLLKELTDLRPSIPVWLAERTVVLGDELLAPGVREGREAHEYSLEDLWNSGQSQFTSFAQNILDRRMNRQDVIPLGTFEQNLRGEIYPSEVKEAIAIGAQKILTSLRRHRSNAKYSGWLQRVDELSNVATLDALQDLYVARVLIERDERKRQLSLELTPLSDDELVERDSSQLQAAAEIMMREELGIPYYYGVERLCILANNNPNELLQLAAALFEKIKAKRILRKEFALAPIEQDKTLHESARRRLEFVPRSHTEGTRAFALLNSIGAFCREKTFLPNAPYAPGVTGVRLSNGELTKLRQLEGKEIGALGVLRRVISECVAENLLSPRPSAASTSRQGGTVFYLSRGLCAAFGLPLQMGGWQDVSVKDLAGWMEEGRVAARGLGSM
ncbi:hypothetical protein LJ725_26605 [Reyranella aquatilis]|uniref:ATP-binding protein n=1 Tax=Reyranella aquatilis TaxID=2035356 RepID=A0ABS8L2J1_9HYPH|nr:hypothetical protein [Reyranella aquatilis]MCC8432557.1 hypothetical protein [Reyranella aquatilis]